MTDIPAWLAYVDREGPAYNPVATEQIITNHFFVAGEAKFTAPGRAYEEWLIRSALVPSDKADRIASSAQLHSLESRPSWCEGAFDFGELERLGDVLAFVWVRIHRNPVLRNAELRIRQDFLDYHCLRKEGNRYVHPIDGVPVLEATIQQIRHWEESPHVTVHVDYLCDFLAVRGWALYLQVIADRFAVAASEADLGVSSVELRNIGENTWQTVVIHAPGGLAQHYYVGRSSLYWNIIVPPYPKPKVDRSPWRWSFHENTPASEAPLFIVDEQGTKASLQDDLCPAYLHFRREVLQRYQTEPGYVVNFHMRTWGLAAPVASEETIDVGINSVGLVNAFAPDLAKLRTAELHHWASFSCPPAGGICHEMFETRMQNNPPRSECVVEIVQTAIQRLDGSFRKRFGSSLHALATPGYPDSSRLNVGPLGHRVSEVAALAKTLYEWAVDPLSIKALCSAIRGLGKQYDDEWKQIRLLEAIIGSKSDTDAHSLIEPLSAINALTS